MDVEDIETLLNELRAKQKQFRSLNEASYKIL